jgi:hypothetical protein
MAIYMREVEDRGLQNLNQFPPGDVYGLWMGAWEWDQASAAGLGNC